jgi:hypothetical protein
MDKKPSGIGPLTAIGVMLSLPLWYALSVGPVLYLANRLNGSAELMRTLYWPLMRFCDAVGATEVFVWYCRLFVP